jgi:predicted DCC family thiol-disulfide oxidoreductase YuxK
MNTEKNSLKIIYDGECPFCKSYVRFLDLKDCFETVNLVDARTNPEAQEQAKKLGYDLDEGFLVFIDDDIYHGKDAVTILAKSTHKNGVFNKINGAMFHSHTGARVIYPIFVVFRNLTLKLLGKKKINS